MFLVCSWERYGQFCMYAACIGLRDTDIDLVFFFYLFALFSLHWIKWEQSVMLNVRVEMMIRKDFAFC